MGYLYLVRHGQTHWNKSKIMHGQYDIPLNDKGIEQARNLSEKLKHEQFDICFCSPLERARKTAIEILKYHPNTKIIFDNRLLELNKGLLEGVRSVQENILVKEDSRILEKYKVESKQQFFLRVKSFLDEYLPIYKDKKVLIVSHSGTTKMIMFYFDPPKEDLSFAYSKVHISNCSFKKIKIDLPLKISKNKLYNNNEEINHNKKEVKDMKIGLYPMVADILHTGHIAAIEEAKKHCDYLIVALHCCPNYKNPIQTIFERFMQLRAVKWVDEIIPYTDIEDAKSMFKTLDYDVYFLGEDHKFDKWECRDLIESSGKEIVYLKRAHGFSSSDVKDRVIKSLDKNKDKNKDKVEGK